MAQEKVLREFKRDCQAFGLEITNIKKLNSTSHTKITIRAPDEREEFFILSLSGFGNQRARENKIRDLKKFAEGHSFITLRKQK